MPRIVSESMEEELLTSVFKRCKERLRLSARKFLDDDNADDALQEAFCRLWNRRAEFKSESMAEGMTFTTVRNICIDTLRRKTVRNCDELNENTAELADDNSDNDDITERYRQVSQLIESRLNERDRKILYLRDRDGWEMDEISEETGLTEANVRVILSRARKTVRECYRNQHKNTYKDDR